jgi:competence protein ComEC
MNISIIAAIFITLFRRWLGARLGMAAAVAGISIYTVLVGADAAVVRAAIMGCLTLLALRIGRRTHALASLAAAGFLMTLINPHTLWDVGFQLSFMATLGLVLYGPPLQEGFSRIAGQHLPPNQLQPVTRMVSEYFLFTIAAQITTTPLTAAYFHRFSLISFLANPIILPAQPPLMILGGISTFLGALWLPLGQISGWLAGLFPAFTIRAVTYMSGLPAASLAIAGVSPLHVTGIYLVMCAATCFQFLPADRRAQARDLILRLRPARTTFLITLLLIAVLVWGFVRDRPDGYLRVIVLDVGPGDSVLIQTPDQKNILIDGGSSVVRLSEKLGEHLPRARRKIDWLVVGGANYDQIGGLLGAVEYYPVENALICGNPTGRAFDRIHAALQNAGTSLFEAQAGQRLTFAEHGVVVVQEVTPAGAVLLVSYLDLQILLLPGADPALVSRLHEAGNHADLTAVLLPDGGNYALNPSGWLETLNPRLALISVAAGDSGGSPSREVLDILSDRTVLRTDRHGDIRIVSDGRTFWVEVSKYPAHGSE